MDVMGGCLCGAVRYRVSGTPVRKFVCHCRDCQRASGSAFHFGITVPREAFTVTTGEPRAYASKGESGRDVARYFCPTCGSGLFNEIALRPGFVTIRAGTLDDPNAAAPNYELFTSSKMSWAHVAGVADSFSGMTPPDHKPPAT